MGVRGATGDLSDREGLVGWAVEMLRDSLGLAAERIILTRMTERGLKIKVYEDEDVVLLLSQVFKLRSTKTTWRASMERRRRLLT
jgi:hypothetical protein